MVQAPFSDLDLISGELNKPHNKSEGEEVRTHTHGVIRLTTHMGSAPALYKKEDGASGY